MKPRLTLVPPACDLDGPRWFVECRNGDHWLPCLFRDCPEIGDDRRIRRIGGIGPVVRRKPVRIAAEHLGLDLDTLQDIYGALGR